MLFHREESAEAKSDKIGAATHRKKRKDVSLI